MPTLSPLSAGCKPLALPKVIPVGLSPGERGGRASVVAVRRTTEAEERVGTRQAQKEENTRFLLRRMEVVVDSEARVQGGGERERERERVYWSNK